MNGKLIAFFPEAAFGPALNSVGIAQACEKLGHKAVFQTDPGIADVYSGYGMTHTGLIFPNECRHGPTKVTVILNQWLE